MTLWQYKVKESSVDQKREERVPHTPFTNSSQSYPSYPGFKEEWTLLPFMSTLVISKYRQF